MILVRNYASIFIDVKCCFVRVNGVGGGIKKEFSDISEKLK
jgi:hypothetical protein